MSSEVDQRVVQMKFDNAQFEAGVQQTLQSLNKLNKSIDENTKANNGKSLTGLTSAVSNLTGNFGKVESAADAISKKFSVFGTIGDQVLRRIADGAVGTAKKLVSMVNSPLEQIKNGGWARASNINNARFQLNGLKVAWDSVNKDLQYAVNQTAYGLDSAANVASQLTASGIKIRDNIKLTADNVDSLADEFKGMKSKALLANGSLDEMSIALRAISGVAAQTNSSYDDIGNVFTRVAGQGRVMATDLNSLAARGMNAAATLGKALGKSEAEIRDMVSKGQIDFQTFSEAMYDAFADHAIDANNTFSGALANMKAALSKIGAEFFLPFLERVPKLFNAIRIAINDVKTDIMPLIKIANNLTAIVIDALTKIVTKLSDVRKTIFADWQGNGGIEALTRSFVNAVNALYRVIDPIAEAFTEVFGGINGKQLAGATTSLERFTQSLLISREAMIKIKSTFIDIFSVIKAIYQIVKPFAGLIVSVMLISTVLSSIKSIFTGGLGLGTVLSIVKVLVSLGLLKKLKSGSKLLQVIVGILKLVAGAIITIVAAVAKLFKTIASSSIMSKLSSALKVLQSFALVAISKIIQGVTKLWSIIKSFNIGEKIVKLGEIAKEVGAVILEVLWKIFDFLTGGTKLTVHAAEVGESFDKVGKSAKNIISPITKLKDAVSGFIDLIRENKKETQDITSNVDSTKKSLDNVNSTISNVKETTDGTVSSVKGLSSLISGFSSSFSKWIDKIKSGTSAFQMFSNLIKNVAPTLSSINWDKILAIGTILLYAIAIKNLTKSVDVVSQTIEKIVGFFTSLRTAAVNMMGSISGAFGSLKGLFDTMNKNYKVGWFKNIAVGVGILAASLIALGFVPWQNLLQGSIVITALATAVILLVSKLAKISALIDPAKLNSLSLTLLSIANLLGVMSVTIGVIALVTNHVISTSQSWQEALVRIAAPLAVFATEIGAIIGILAVLSKFSPALVKLGAGIAAVAGGILAFSAALISLQVALIAIKVLAAQIIADIMLLAKAFVSFGKANIDPEKIASVTLAILVLVTAGVGFYAILEKLKDVATQAAKAAALLAASMLILAIACKTLSTITSVSEDGMTSMAEIMGVFILSIAALGTPIIQKGIENLKGVGKAALALSAAMLILAGAVAVLGNIDDTTLAKGVLAIATAMITLGVALGIIKSQTGDLSKAVAVILAFTFALYALVPVVTLFGAAWKVAAPGIAMVSALMLALAKSCEMLNKVNAKKIVAMVATIGVTLLGLLYVFESLSDIDSDKLISIAASLAIVVGSIGGSMALMSVAMKSLNAVDLVGMVVTLGSLTLAAGVLADTMQKLANVPYQNILSFALVLGVFGAAAAAIIAVISSFSAGLLVASPALLAFAAVLASAGIAFVGFGAGSVLFGKAVQILTTAITAFIPSLEQFIAFIASLSGQAIDVLQIAGSLAVLGVALVPLGIGMTSAAVGAGLLSGAMLLGAVALTSFGTAASLAIPGISGLLSVFEQLITFCVEIGQQVDSMLKMAGALALLGAALIPFGTGSVAASVGIAALTAALLAFSAAITAFSSAATSFSIAVDRVTVSVNKLKTAVSGIKSTFSELNTNAKTWGSDMVTNYAKGMTANKKMIAVGANSIAHTIWEYLHFCSGPEKGEIAGNTVYTWGGDMKDMFGLGILNSDNSSLNAGLTSMTDYIDSFKGAFADKGTELAESFGSSLTSGLASALSWASEKFGNLPVIGKGITKAYNNVKKSQEKSKKKENLKKNITGNEYYREHGGGSGKKKTDIKNSMDLLNYDDLIKSQDDATKSLGGSTDALDANTSALGKNSKGSGGASKSTSDLAEQQKVLAKYTKYATQTMDTYMKAFGMAFSAANSTDLISNTKEAFGELAEYIYQETQKNSDATTDATQTAEERAQAVMKAFNEAFESIRDTAKNSLDMFSSFDKKLSDKITPKEMLANFESQEKGVTQFYDNLGTLAAKGFNTGLIKSLMDEGPSAYAKVSGLLSATADEIDKLNEHWNSKESIANKAAATAMTALMTSMQITKLKTLDAQRKKSVDTANKALTTYKEKIKEAQDANLDMEATLKIVQDQAADTGKTMEESGPTADLITSYNDLQKAMTEAGLSNDDLQTAMMDDSGFKFTENSMLTLINKIADLKSTIAQFEDVGSQINDNVKSQLSSSISYFDEWSAKYELTGEQLMKNVQSQIEGIAKYNDNIKTIMEHGGGQIVALFGDKITPEIANAMAQLGNSALQTLQQQLQYIQAAPVQAGQQAQQAWFQYGQIGGMGYQDALSQLAQNQALMQQATTIGTNVAQGAVNGMTQSTSAVAAAGQQVGQAAINGVATGAQTHSPSVATTTMGQNIDQGLINGVNALSEAVVAACRAVGVRAVNGMQSGVLMTKYALLGTVRTMVQQVVTTVRNGLSQDIFYTVGQNICNGLVNGINSGWSWVIDAAKNLADSAYNAARHALDEHSPSKKMYQVGEYFDAGFANGVANGASSMTSTVTDTMQDALQTAVDLMNNTGEMQPTIRPVVDLSDAQNGSRLLSSMFNDIRPMRVNAGVGQITTPTDRMNAAIAGMNSGSTVTNGDTVLNIYAQPGQNTKELADIVIKRLNNEYARRKAAWT